MSERFVRGVSAKIALYKCSSFPFLLLQTSWYHSQSANDDGRHSGFNLPYYYYFIIVFFYFKIIMCSNSIHSNKQIVTVSLAAIHYYAFLSR